MPIHNKLLNPNGPRQLVLKRLYAAPIAIVYRAWIEPSWVQRWWGPLGFENRITTWEAKPNGAITVLMAEANGTTLHMRGTFHELDDQKRLLFSTAMLVEGVLSPQLKVLYAVKFSLQGPQTELAINATVQHTELIALPWLRGMEKGWMQSLDKLEEVLKANL